MERDIALSLSMKSSANAAFGPVPRLGDIAGGGRVLRLARLHRPSDWTIPTRRHMARFTFDARAHASQRFRRL